MVKINEGPMMTMGYDNDVVLEGKWSDRRKDETNVQYFLRMRDEFDKLEKQVRSLTIENEDLKSKLKTQNPLDSRRKINMRNDIIANALENVTTLLVILCLMAVLLSILCWIAIPAQISKNEEVSTIFIVGSIVCPLLFAIFFMLANNGVFEKSMKLYFDIR